MNQSTKLIDFHVHAIPFDDSHGCIASPWFRASRLLPLRLRLGLRRTSPSLNDSYIELLLCWLESSRYVGRAVLLAMDTAYSRDPGFAPRRPHFFVPDEYVFEWCRRSPRFIPGISVHPARPDALEALERGAERGAVLVKWLPNTQHIDLIRDDYSPFFAKLVDLGLSLLIHSGSEYSVAGSRHDLGDPRHWEVALAAGVTVIGAHAGSSGNYFKEPHAETIRDFLRRYPNFYLDSSASVANRGRMLRLVAGMPEARGRIVFASDVPVPASVLPWHSGLSLAESWRTYRTKNEFDRHVEMQRAQGIEPSHELAEKLLAQPRRRQ